MSDNYFLKMNAVDVNEHTEKKAGLTYLSWAWAWTEVASGCDLCHLRKRRGVELSHGWTHLLGEDWCYGERD